ncbi:DUF7504 family protein [Halorussus marinus]|uniref:DUF7504 family protein n=1 Tax=Halorussus marinus TaxID=2505976 RepID=UPI0010919C4F|nr:HalOD1 output domain-containing protein [Halorussus marinus]
MNERSPPDPAPLVDAARRTCHDPRSDRPVTTTVIETVAAAADADSLELPPLYEQVSPDALNEFVASATDASDRAGHVTVAFPFHDRLVSVTRAGRIGVSSPVARDARRERLRPEPTVRDSVVVHRADDDERLSKGLLRAVASTTGLEPAAVTDRFADLLGTDAIDTLFRPRANDRRREVGAVWFPFRKYDVTVFADRTIELRPTLSRLKRTGGNVLVVGSVPDDVIGAVSAPLLGAPDLDRTRLIALHGTTVETACARLRSVETTGADAHVIDSRASARSATAVDPDTGVRVSEADGGLDDLATRIDDAIESFERQSELDPAELRFCLDSLGSLARSHDSADVASFLRSVIRSVDRVSGIGHYVLPAPRDAEVVRTFEPLFDAVVEVGVGADGPIQRWHLEAAGYTTDWFPA